MAATETRTEAEEHLAPLVCKTLVLKVSIHCQGCQRKVMKILKGTEGVYSVDIDLRQQKVMVTGIVDSETLIKKLIAKTGKHAELWPEKADSKKKTTEIKEKQSDHAESTEIINQSSENDEEPVHVKVVAQDISKTAENSANNNNNIAKNTDPCAGGNVNKANGVQFQEPKPEVRQSPAAPATERKVSVAVQVPNEIEAQEIEKTGDGNGGKKKKKKGKGNNNSSNQCATDATTATTATVTVEQRGAAPVNGASSNQSHGQSHVPNPGPGHAGSGSVPFPIPANQSPPRHHIYHQYPPHYYAPPPTVHTVSYHTAHPSSSYGAAYYAAPQPYSYAHVVRPGNEMEPSPPYVYESESYTSSQPSDSFELFSDENPNACSVM